jgi:tyrosine-protein kinase Etk/Wzc
MPENFSDENKKGSNLIGSSFIDFLYVIAKARNFLIIFIFIIVAFAIIFALLLPKEYKASASVFPAEQSNMLSALSGISSLAKSFSPLSGLSGLGGTSEVDRFIAILKSNSVQRRTIEQFNLRKVYDLEGEPFWKVQRELTGNLEFNIQDEGNLVISVFDKDPKLSADIANYLVELLNEINTELHVTNARASREFIEKRYFQNLDDLKRLEVEMKEFQIQHGVIAVPEQVEATLKAIAELYVELSKEEVELNVLRKSVEPNHPLLEAKEIQLSEIKKQLNTVSSTQGTFDDKSQVLIPLKNAPELLEKYLNIYKNLEIQYKIAEFITPVYEQAKIEEARNTPSVLVLDEAYPPERKAKPKIALYALIGFVVSLVIGLFLVFLLELLIKLQRIDPLKYQYISNAFKPLFRWIPRTGETK